MPDPKQALPQGDPHSAGFFTRLAQLFKRGEIPANVARPTARPVGDDEEDGACPVDGDSAAMATWLGDKLSMPSDRARQLSIWEEMDATGLVSSLLDVYAAESAAQDYDRGVSVWIESAAPHIIQAGKECLANVQMEDRIVPLTRRMCKQGDAFQRLIYSTGKGVLGWRHAPTEKVTRYEDKYQRLVGFKQTGQVYRGNLKREVSWPWDYVHFRLLGKDEESGYGTSLLSNMFRDWRAMMLINDAALLYRLRRGVDRNMVMVDIQNMEEHEAIDYVNRFKKALRKQEFIDPASPNYRKSYNPLTPMEDIFIPIRGSDSQTRVETLSAAGSIGEMFDLEHVTNSFFGSAGAPKAYFGFEGDVNAKATLTQLSVQFARNCKRIQRAVKYGIRTLTDIHFTLLRTAESGGKYDVSKSDNEYLVQMSPISYLDEWERLELVQLRYQIVSEMAGMSQTMGIDPRVWSTYVLLNYAKIPEDLVLKLVSKMPEGGAPAPTTDVQGEGSHFHGLSSERRAEILDNLNESRNGFYQLTEDEKKQIAVAIHRSPKLRQIISHFAELYEDDKVAQQIDPSRLPPFVNGNVFEDSFAEDVNAKTLMEDLAAATGKKLKD